MIGEINTLKTLYDIFDLSVMTLVLTGGVLTTKLTVSEYCDDKKLYETNIKKNLGWDLEKPCFRKTLKNCVKDLFSWESYF